VLRKCSEVFDSGEIGLADGGVSARVGMFDPEKAFLQWKFQELMDVNSLPNFKVPPIKIKLQ